MSDVYGFDYEEYKRNQEIYANAAEDTKEYIVARDQLQTIGDRL